MLFLFHPSHPPCIVYYLVSSIYETHFPPPPPLPFVFLVIPAHLYFVSVRMSGIVRETQEEARFFFIYYFFFPFLHACTIRLFNCFFFFFSVAFDSLFPFCSLDLLFPCCSWNETRRDDQWMQRSDTFRQYITINYTYIIIN